MEIALRGHDSASLLSEAIRLGCRMSLEKQTSWLSPSRRLSFIIVRNARTIIKTSNLAERKVLGSERLQNEHANCHQAVQHQSVRCHKRRHGLHGHQFGRRNAVPTVCCGLVRNNLTIVCPVLCKFVQHVHVRTGRTCGPHLEKEADWSDRCPPPPPSSPSLFICLV